MAKGIKSNEAMKVKRRKKTTSFYKSGSREIFYSSKILFKLVKRIEGFETKLQVLESPDSDKRAKNYTKTKIRSGIVIRKIADLIREKKNDEQINERTFVNRI